jgi:hypothetical protein
MADTSSAFPQLTRARGDLSKEMKRLFGEKLPKEVYETLSDETKWKSAIEQIMKKKESSHVRISNVSAMRESSKAASGKRFEVVIIEEGLGNFGTCFYYSEQLINTLPQVFEGRKMFANHPSNFESQDRPERDVRDIVAYFENVSAKRLNGRMCLMSEAVVPDGDSFDWARKLMMEAVDYGAKHPTQELIGISINADGEATDSPIDDVIAMAPAAAAGKLREAKAKGIETVKVVTSITEADSADLVTEAGAGGKILKIMEGDKTMADDNKNKGADGGSSHGDADKDKAMVADMLKKHMGKDDGDPTEAHHEMYSEFASGGSDKEEAAKMACASVKAMQKREKAATEKKEADEKSAKEAADKKEKEEAEAKNKQAAGDSGAGGDGNDKTKQESDKDNMTLAGRVAFLESELRKERVTSHMDKVLKESKLSRTATDTFRESFKKKHGDAKSLKQIDDEFSVFLEGYKAKSAEGEVSLFGFAPEKVLNDETTGTLDLSECVK